MEKKAEEKGRENEEGEREEEGDKGPGSSEKVPGEATS